MKLRFAQLLVGPLLALYALGPAISTTSAQTVTILYSFGSTVGDGANPNGALFRAGDGNLYGTAQHGGTSNYGTVFRINPDGSYTNLYSFGSFATDGHFPGAGLVQGSDGNFYGTTVAGGSTNLNSGLGCGTVFRISPSGSYTNLYSLAGSPNDGLNPFGVLVQGGDGDFYGTTEYGGANLNCSMGCGTVFRISSSGSYTNLYSFAGPPDVYGPIAGLAQGRDGDFYGMAGSGGTNFFNNGSVFRISSGGNYTNLHFLIYPNDGALPNGGLVQGSDGNFYGMANVGGAHNDGIVFRVSPGGSYTNLYSFAGPPSDGTLPQRAGLVQGSDGNFYGTTSQGGTSTNCTGGCGTLFRISPSGNYTNLYSFGNSANDGRRPFVGLIQGSDGNFYGTTTLGGINNSGTVFRLTVPLSPPPYPINQITGVWLSDTNVVLNIPSIASETYQLQFSSSMNPTNWVNVPGVSVTNSIGALLTLTNFGGAVGPQGFYRFDITP